MCFEKIKPSFNEVNRYALEMIKRHELSLETLNKVGHNFAEWVMTPEEEAKGFSPIAGQGFMNKAAQLGANLAGGNGGNSGNGPNVPPGGFQSPPPSGFQGPPPGFQGPPSGGYGGGFGGNGGWGQGGQGGGYNPQPYNSNNQFNPDNYLALPSNSASAALVDSTKDYKVLKIGVRQWVKIDNQSSTTSSGNSNPVYGFAPYYAMFLIENDTDANAWLTVLNNKLSGSSLAITEIGALQNSTLETYTTTMQPFCIVKADAGGASQTAALEATLLAALTTTYGGIQRIDRDSTAGNTRYTVWSTASLGTVTTAAGTIVSCVAGECVTDADDTYL